MRHILAYSPQSVHHFTPDKPKLNQILQVFWVATQSYLQDQFFKAQIQNKFYRLLRKSFSIYTLRLHQPWETRHISEHSTIIGVPGYIGYVILPA